MLASARGCSILIIWFFCHLKFFPFGHVMFLYYWSVCFISIISVHWSTYIRFTRGTGDSSLFAFFFFLNKTSSLALSTDPSLQFSSKKPYIIGFLFCCIATFRVNNWFGHQALCFLSKIVAYKNCLGSLHICFCIMLTTHCLQHNFAVTSNCVAELKECMAFLFRGWPGSTTWNMGSFLGDAVFEEISFCGQRFKIPVCVNWIELDVTCDFSLLEHVCVSHKVWTCQIDILHFYTLLCKIETIYQTSSVPFFVSSFLTSNKLFCHQTSASY